MARYVVTGGAGFIGSHLVDMLLGRGHAVCVLDDLSTGFRHNVDPRAQLVVGDVRDAALVGRLLADTDGCFHLAAIASVARANEDWIGTSSINLGGTVAVLDAARKAGCIPVVYASSAAVYGRQVADPLHEALTPAPLSAYGADKLACELHARVAFEIHRVPTGGLRFFNVFGPRQDPRSPYSGVISIFADRMLAGHPIRIEGDGLQTRDFIFVSDVVRHLLASMATLHAHPRAFVANACTGQATSVLDLARAVGRAAGIQPAIAHGPARPGDMRSAIGSFEQARRELRVAAVTSFAEGLAATVASLHAKPLALVA